MKKYQPQMTTKSIDLSLKTSVYMLANLVFILYIRHYMHYRIIYNVSSKVTPLRYECHHVHMLKQTKSLQYFISKLHNNAGNTISNSQHSCIYSAATRTTYSFQYNKPGVSMCAYKTFSFFSSLVICSLLNCVHVLDPG